MVGSHHKFVAYRILFYILFFGGAPPRTSDNLSGEHLIASLPPNLLFPSLFSPLPTPVICRGCRGCIEAGFARPKHWCYVCLGPWPCLNASANGCNTFCDATCDCPDCPDCAPGKPCANCSGVQGGCRVCSGEAGKGPAAEAAWEARRATATAAKLATGWAVSEGRRGSEGGRGSEYGVVRLNALSRPAIRGRGFALPWCRNAIWTLYNPVNVKMALIAVAASPAGPPGNTEACGCCWAIAGAEAGGS